MKRIGVFVLLLGAVWMIGCSWNALGMGMKEEKRQLELSAAGMETLDVETSSGRLIIKGDDKADAIRADAVIRRPGYMKKDAIVVTLEKDGKTAKLVSEMKLSAGVQNLSLTITVTVPSGMNLKINDGSGDLEISDVKGTTDIEDGSGSMKLVRVSNLRSIEDGSGSIRLEHTGGNVKIVDGSGDIHLVGHMGDVDVMDGSGEIEVRDLKGDLVVEDSSGNIMIRNVDGDVTIKEDGSGNLSVEGVKGKYTRK